MKKLLLLLAMAVMVIGLVAGCGKSADNGGDKKSGTIGFSVSTLNNPFFVTMKEGVEAQAKALGLKVKIVDAQNDPAKQANDISDLLESGVSVLIINPVDSAAISTSVEAANAKNISVITVDRSEIEGIPGASATRERGQGFHNVADKDLTVVAKQSADFDRTKGLNVATNILQANPDVQAIFAHNDEMALGAIQAAKSAGKTIFIVGFDGTADADKAVKDGTLAATIAQQPDQMGKIAIDTAQKVIKGEAVEAKIPVDLKVVTK